MNRNESLTFGEAVALLEEGKMVSRLGWWSDLNLFVFRQVPSTINEVIVPNMQSLPQLVKDEFVKRFADKENFQLDALYYTNQLAIVNKSNLIQSYSPSVEDALVKDWYTYG